MSIALWITSGLLAAIYLAAGLTKAVSPYEKLGDRMAWTKDVGKPLTRFIGVVEVLGALGVVLPRMTGIAPWLSVAAAFGLALVQMLAIGFHVRRREYQVLPGNVILLALAAFTGIGLLTIL